ncbi:MAG: phage holin family protein [Terrimicrobiaceae bacterium]|nr:phage holin family protein [Terrimicrobiaceae bacterium]
METTGHTGGPVPGGHPVSEPRGLLDGLLSLVGSFGRYFEAIGALAGEEAREAAALYLRLAVMLAAALFFAAFGYVLLLLFAAFLIAAIFPVSWLWILLGFTILHLLVAVICATHVKTHWRTPVFPATKGEISRDLEALRGGREP